MKHELEQLDFVANVSGGMESIENDINLIEQFLAHANGCGLESLDTPAGALIESGLAARYADHFKAGSGLEGLGELVGTLKKGLDGLKKRFKGKLPAELTKATGDLENAIKKTYGNSAWFADKDETDKPVSTVELAKLVGDVKSGGEVVSAVSAAFKQYDTALNNNLKEVSTYIAKTHEVLRQARTHAGDDAALTKFANEQIAILEPLHEKLAYKTVDVKGGQGVTDAKLTKEQCIAIGKEMARIPGWIKTQLNKSDSQMDNALGQAALDSIDGGEENKAFSKLFWNYLCWETVLGTNEQLLSEAGRLIRPSVVAMESMIITALK